MDKTVIEFFSKLKTGDIVFNNILNAVKSGNNNLSLNAVQERVKSDDSWIDEIDNLLFSLEIIVKDPQRSLKDEEAIVQIEKAKRITADSVRHLAAHSNFIKSIDDDGTVHPSKIKTHYLDEDLHIYENRFIYTLIVRLLSFIEQKYNYYIENPQKYDTVTLNHKSQINYGGTIIDYDLNIKAKKPLQNESNQTSAIDKLKKIKRRLLILTGSDFFNKLSRTKPLNPPISKTNILKMNVDYNNCYKLWLLLYSFVSTGYSVKVSEIELPENQEYIDDLSHIVAISIKTLMDNSPLSWEENKYKKQPEKEYNIIKEFNYKPQFCDFKLKELKQEDYLNQYYYEKIKEILLHQQTRRGEQDIVISEDFAFLFTDFYSQLAQINNTLFEEMINTEQYDTTGKKLTQTEKIRNELNKNRQIFARRHLLSGLKNIDINFSKKRESLLLAKIKKLEYQIERLKAEKEDTVIPVKSVDKRKKTRKQIVSAIKSGDDKIAKKIIEEAEKEEQKLKNNNEKSKK